MNIYITKKDDVWRVMDKVKYTEDKYPSFKTRNEALHFLKSEYANTDTRAIVSGENGKFQMHIIFKEKEDVELKFVKTENPKESLKQEERDDITRIFQIKEKPQAKEKVKEKTKPKKTSPIKIKGVSKVEIKIKAYEASLVDGAAAKIIAAAKAVNAKVSGPIPLPTRREVFTILRSVHVNKKSREQFEMRTHKRLIIIEKADAKLLDGLQRLELSSGIKLELKTK